ncbi:relaxase/mobilization nuclease domain-containing protein [Actinomycetaceae bacterium UMB8039B]|uniref:relaxase/mobilization nuclease domain-containing protein n=1 Tax=unclassified Pauljensenia TaxID=2908895 RepID=UPI0015CBB2E0|nr:MULTISPECIES: relaxase/mobilization nuclease domain-containing protein [unclassified Pauljensenia]MDK7781007.1 relaxase/mobilization nuclease domain-containing protein [Actinomycetaceae bacterium UMB8041B]MDK8293742.1 relaxase/mobilization nuclease domain-containing protein [Actinomycetaceae bacterium UMB8039B]MDK8608329.1 relaxase/mobilization nuclease domain-containing protein [Actinomycetaceae bacterium UMB8041A]MDK8753548.1 relaxase/mobilization nuclease domain-containing protein [Actino
MSITKQTTTVRAAAAIMYAHFGKPADVKQSRAAAWRSDFRTPYDAITSIESMLKGTGRKNQALMVIQSFSADELDTNDPATPQIVADAAYALAKEVAPNSPCDVVVHLDSDGGNPHAHVTIANVDLVTGRAARENGLAHWVLKKANDKIMREMGLGVLKADALAHDVNRSRSGASAQGLTVDELDKSTWREFLADRVDEALLDPRSVDFDSLRTVAREHGVSIEKKTSAKSEAAGRDPSVTYALVDDNDEVRRFGRSKAACTARKLGADYGWASLHNTMNERMMREQEIEDVQSFTEDGEQLDAALRELRAAEEDRGFAPRRGRIAGEPEEGTHKRRAGDDHAHERVEIVDADLGGLAARLADERRKRDQEDAERAERDAQRARRDSFRQARRENERRLQRERLRTASTLDDEAAQQQSDEDDFGLG